MTLQQCLATAEDSRQPARSPRQCPVCGHAEGGTWLQAPDRFHCRKRPYSLLRCPECSLVWLESPPPPEEMSEHYGPDYDCLIAGSGENSPENWQPRLETLLKYASGGALLDLGCSSGGFLSLLQGNWQLHGVEISDEPASKARARTGAQIWVGDVLAAPFANASFDAITCFHVFEHMFEPRLVLGKVWDWLKPGGIFLAEMPNIDCQEARFFGSYWYPLELPRHLFHFSPKSFRRLADSFGFEELSLTTSRANFVDYHIRYLVDGALAKFGISRLPIARAKPSLPWKAVRKMLRLGVYPALSCLTSCRGDAAIMQVVLRKPDLR